MLMTWSALHTFIHIFIDVCFFVFPFLYCHFSEDNVDLLREMGGVVFVYNLSKSSIVHSDVKETALFTLTTLAEANGTHVFWIADEGWSPINYILCSIWSQ